MQKTTCHIFYTHIFRCKATLDKTSIIHTKILPKIFTFRIRQDFLESLVKVSVSTTFGKSRSVSVSTTNKFSSLDQSRSRDFVIRVSVSVSMTRLAFSLDGLSLETMILVSLFTAMTLLLNGLSPKFLL